MEELQCVKKLKEDLMTDGEKEVIDNFPSKAVELQELLKSNLFVMGDDRDFKNDWTDCVPVTDLSNSDEPNGEVDEDKCLPKKRKVETRVGPSPAVPVYSYKASAPTVSGPIKCNRKLLSMANRLKPELVTAQEKLNVIKVWVTLSIPKVEDGNNFGVSVQEEVLGEVVKCEGDVVSYLDQINRYFVTRAKMASKVAKYPMIDDYRQALDEYDQKVFHNFRVILQELRNTYLLIHDLALKNVDKIRHPRSANMGALY